MLTKLDNCLMDILYIEVLINISRFIDGELILLFTIKNNS